MFFAAESIAARKPQFGGPNGDQPLSPGSSSSPAHKVPGVRLGARFGCLAHLEYPCDLVVISG